MTHGISLRNHDIGPIELQPELEGGYGVFEIVQIDGYRRIVCPGSLWYPDRDDNVGRAETEDPGPARKPS